MRDEFANLSDLELLSLIHRAEEEVARRKEAIKERLRAKFEEELKQAGLGLSDIFPEFEAESPRDEAPMEAPKPRWRNSRITSAATPGQEGARTHRNG
jgi:hypothetical protein